MSPDASYRIEGNVAPSAETLGEAYARIEAQSAQIARLREAIEPFRERLLVKRRGPFSHGVACPAEDTDTDNVACTCGAWDAIDRLAAALADPTGADWLRERLDAEREACVEMVLDELDGGSDGPRSQDALLSRIAERIRARSRGEGAKP